MTDVALAFRDADGPLRAALVHCLDFMNDLPAFRAYKERSWTSLGLAPGKTYLDVACGVGFDVMRMASAHPNAAFIGVDRSRAFLDLAGARAAGLGNASFLEGDADRLPFPDDAFDGARIDRSLQHIAAPAAAVAEMARVVRPGGRVVATEPDWGTFVLYNGDGATNCKVADKWLESIAHPFIGRELGTLFERAGIADIGCRAHVLAFSRFEEAEVVFDLTRLQENCVAAGLFSVETGREWRAAAERASQTGVFLACLTIVERWGTVKGS
ncbi:methyltransferase domain-containing protein [Methylocystis parvus]|uniref:methyltransferase domain-containing protein n=1 Tax=Methylocystis parvus TaxID=134 RepID=UPI003C78F434